MQRVKVIKVLLLSFSLIVVLLLFSISGIAYYLFGMEDVYTKVDEYKLDNNISVDVLQLEKGGATVGFIYSYTVRKDNQKPQEFLKANTGDAEISMRDGVLFIKLIGEVYKLDNRIRFNNTQETLQTEMIIRNG
ncbi:hypothetical protein Bresa_00175|uniref:Uncharacterized protein n=1 Tax=Brenneria salicis ATCC 15712 = DSM 30166 TaxID=714314 RepID=A0A366I6P0_9GAMM|nr:hypothetical protein [Brenneria salicis]NMN90133.1 hypothetical protein [Brenneria salicis ATCC 15712 = DSM 30166]RBP63247.1 hypothetical protein DES54_11270 [Brenneria salicis ATCC 15712 = DSM 30166]